MKKVRIPKLLREFHGEYATVSSLIVVYLTGIIFGLTVFVAANDMLSGWRLWLLLLFAVDIGAGTVANFTLDTSDYWAKQSKKTLIFIAVHLVHLSVIWLPFPDEKLIWIAGIGILLFTLIVSLTRREANQRIMASSFVLLAIAGLTFLEVSTIPKLVLYVMSVKLILGFAVRWNHNVIN